MSTSRNNGSSAPTIQPVLLGRRPTKYTVEDVVKLVIVNDICVDQALAACALQTTIPASTIYSRVKVRRERGTYDALIRKRIAEARQVGLVIDMSNDDAEVSPVTMNTIQSSSSSESTRKKKPRQSPKQASATRLEAKRLKLDYDGRYSAAFKDAMNLVAGNANGEPVQSICERLNKQFNLD